MSMDGQGTKCRRKIAEIYNRLSRVHERYRQTTDRQTTDGRATAYSERTFANKTYGMGEIFLLKNYLKTFLPNPY